MLLLYSLLAVAGGCANPADSSAADHSEHQTVLAASVFDIHVIADGRCLRQINPVMMKFGFATRNNVSVRERVSATYIFGPASQRIVASAVAEVSSLKCGSTSIKRSRHGDLFPSA